jgi:serine/threonine-protein kinase
MAQWGIKPGNTHIATFFAERENARVISVSEGPTSVYIRGGQFAKMPAVELTGRLIFGDRVYGRITGAKVDGYTFPVCFELQDHIEHGRGLVREPNGSADTAKVWSSVTLETVTRLE